MEILLLACMLALVVLIYSLSNLWRGFSLLEKLLVWFLLITANIVLVMEISGLLGALNKPSVLTIVQFSLMVIAVIVNRIFHIGYPRIKFTFPGNRVREIWVRLWHNKLLSAFGLFVLLNYSYLAILTLRFPQYLSDNLYNHLSRIGFWLQQGSLRHYVGFSPFGMFYPYNNSLLAAFPIVFLRSDNFAGMVQFSSAIMTAIALYLMAVNLGNHRKSSAIIALIFLTYPIVLYEAITVQNDLLVACFTVISFVFLITGFKKNRSAYLVFSTLSLALGIGTNQYIAFVLPGYTVLLLYFVIAQKKLRLITPLIACIVTFILLVGSFSYIQNIVNYGNPAAPQEFIESVTRYDEPGPFLPRIKTNASRLFAQFISCDGLLPDLENICLVRRTSVLRKILPANIESREYLYDVETFSLSQPNRLSAETAWFGPVSWILILPGVILASIRAIRKKKWYLLILLFTSFLFFILISVVKHGWDPYQGRYLITAIALVQPLTARLFESRRFTTRFLSGLASVLSLFIMLYASLSNEFLPTMTHNSLVRLYGWGKENSVMVQKIAYKLMPLAKYDNDVWKMSDTEIKISSEPGYYRSPVMLVDDLVPEDTSLGIAVTRGMFYDYLFRGEKVSRKLTPLIVGGVSQKTTDDFILIAPEVNYDLVGNYQKLMRLDGWILMQRIPN